VAVTSKAKFLLPFIMVQNSFASYLEAGKTSAKLLFNLFKQEGSDGKQVFDNSNTEDVDVIEPMLFIAHQIDAETSVNGHFVFDTWTAASDTKLDANTGASGAGIDRQSRSSGTISYGKELKNLRYSFNGGFSTEYDYRSFNGGFSIGSSFADDNFTLNFKAQYFADQVKLFNFTTQKMKDFESRNIYSLDLSASQILTRADIISFGVTHINQSGALEGTPNTVKVAGTRTGEQLPDSRKRFAFPVKWIHGFSDKLALHLNYRYYTDDWDIKSHTITPALLYSLFDGDGYLEFSYRYYQQDQVKYYQNEFAASLANMTSDSDLRKYQAQQLGVHFSKTMDEGKLFGLNLDEREVTVAFYHYQRSNELSYNALQFSWATKF
jgi:hypothetical protein